MLVDNLARAVADPAHGVDISGGAVDHTLVQADIDATIPQLGGLAVHRPPVCDRYTLAHGLRSAIATAACEYLPGVPWRVHADDHNVILSRWMREMVSIVAPIKAVRPKQPWLSEEAFRSIEERTRAKRLYLKARRRQKADLAAAVLGAW